MQSFNEYASLTLYKLRHNELVAKAESERLALIKQEPVRRLRRAIRINNR